MPIFTPAEKAKLLALIDAPPYAGQSPAAILAMLNTPTTVNNPAPRGTVPVGFNLASIVNACSTASRPGLAAFITAATPLIIAQDAAHIADGLDGLVLLGAVSPADVTAIKAVLFATTPDPNWPATVHGPTPFQSLFPGVSFTHSDGSITAGTATLDMLTEALG